MIVPYWLEDGDEDGEESYKQVLADNIEHFHPGQPGRSCIFIDHDNQTVAGIVHLNGYQPLYKTAELTALFFDKRAFTFKNIAYIYEWLFEDLGLTRINMATQKHNRLAQKINEMMGAKFEAELPMYWGDEPMMLYGLLAPDALAYLERIRKHVKKTDDLGE